MPPLKEPMENECVFSSDRKHRYTLIHRFDPLLGGDRYLMWIGLNPSTADESQLDPTLRRIKGYTLREGYDGFIMLNLFAYRATLPEDMKAAKDPVGPENDKWLVKCARRCGKVVAAWGGDGAFMDRGAHVGRLLQDFELVCLTRLGNGAPGHPLYLKKDLKFMPYA